MKVSVRLFTVLRELAGKSEETLKFSVEPVTVNDVLEELVKQHGEAFRDYMFNGERRTRDHLTLLVNGKNVGLLEGLDTLLNEGDKIAIVPPVGGG